MVVVGGPDDVGLGDEIVRAVGPSRRPAVNACGKCVASHESVLRGKGVTEELIDKLIRIPGLRVPPPTSSFYYKNKRIRVADIAKALRVNYVLDPFGMNMRSVRAITTPAVVLPEPHRSLV